MKNAPPRWKSSKAKLGLKRYFSLCSQALIRRLRLNPCTHPNNSVLSKHTCMTCKMQTLNTRNFSLKVTSRLDRASRWKLWRLDYTQISQDLDSKSLFFLLFIFFYLCCLTCLTLWKCWSSGSGDLTTVSRFVGSLLGLQSHFPAISHYKAISVRSAECCLWSICFPSEMQNLEEYQDKWTQKLLSPELSISSATKQGQLVFILLWYFWCILQ